MVEGGEVKGRMEVKVREWNKKEGDVYVAGGKVRVVGFEGQHNMDHILERNQELTSFRYDLCCTWALRSPVAQLAPHLLPPLAHAPALPA